MSAARVLVADVPWRFGDRLPGKGRGAAKHYRVMTVEQMARFPLPDLERDAYLFFWRVSAMPQEALDVVRFWGFKPKTDWTWVKTRICMRCSGKGYTTPPYAERDGLIAKKWCERCEGRGHKLHFGMGRHSRAAKEICILATRGRPEPLVRNERDVFFAPVGPHSQKPIEFYEKIERFARGPYVELFARRQRPGWLQFGDQLDGAEANP